MGWRTFWEGNGVKWNADSGQFRLNIFYVSEKVDVIALGEGFLVFRTLPLRYRGVYPRHGRLRTDYS
jgi:hypothetical protein